MTGNYEILPSSVEEEPIDAEGNSEFKSLLERRRGAVLRTPYGGSLSIQPEGDSYSYAYGPRGVAGLLRNRYAAGCALFASIGGLSFGYDQGVIANVLVMRDFLARWPVGPWQRGLMSMSSHALERIYSEFLLQLQLWNLALCSVLYRLAFSQTSILDDILYS